MNAFNQSQALLAGFKDDDDDDVEDGNNRAHYGETVKDSHTNHWILWLRSMYNCVCKAMVEINCGSHELYFLGYTVM
jgi:hypothetical protein